MRACLRYTSRKVPHMAKIRVNKRRASRSQKHRNASACTRIVRVLDSVCVTRINATRLGRPRYSKALPLVKRV